MSLNTASTAQGEHLPVRRDEEDGTTTIVVDFGPATDNVHTDIVDDTLMMVWERADRSEDALELELPAGQARTFMKNGVLTIEVRE